MERQVCAPNILKFRSFEVQGATNLKTGKQLIIGQDGIPVPHLGL